MGVIRGAGLFILIPLALLAQTPREIILRSSAEDQRDLDLARNYTYISTREERELDSAGNVKSRESEKFDVTMIYGRPYRRLIEKNGKPLSKKDEEKEARKLDKELAERAKESAKDKAKRAKEEAADLAEQKEFIREVADAYDFQSLGDASVDGQLTWVIKADPKPGYKPHNRRSSILTKMRGTIWVTKKEYRWVKLEAEVIDTISFGLFLFRLNPGSMLTFEQTRVQDELWLPRRAWIRAKGRVGLVKKLQGEIVNTWEGYRRFQTDSRVIGTEGERVVP
jgi:hypothetical protein